MSAFTPNTAAGRQAMLDALGLETAGGLFDGIPDGLRLNRPLDLPEGMAEKDALEYMGRLAVKNIVYKTIFRGAGAYRHYIPSIVKRIAAKEEFVTAYTPYQPEVSQGILQCIFEFQTMICELTGMDAANASVYDGAVAAAEAAAMCREKNRRDVVMSCAANPQVVEVVRTYCAAAGSRLIMAPFKNGVTDPEKLSKLINGETACVYIQQPNFFGLLEEADAIGEIARGGGAKFVVGANPFAMALFAPPGECGADIAVGEGQPLGLPLSFGGPYLGFMACKKELARRLPGRIIGETKDRNGERAFVLTLQAREQHIRREKAASNICSNQAHCALTASAYMAATGPGGMRSAALKCVENAAYLREKLAGIEGYEPVFEGPSFHEFVTKRPIPQKDLERILAERGILAGLPLDGLFPENAGGFLSGGGPAGCVLWCATEMNTFEEMDELADLLRGSGVK